MRLCNPDKADIVANDGRGSDRQRLGVRDIELAELDAALPNLSQEVLEYMDCKLLARAAPVAKAEWREPGMVADWQWPVVDDAVSRAEAAIVD